MELRIVAAVLEAVFDIGFALGEDGTDLVDDCRHAFTSAPGKLEFVFRAQ